MSFINATTHTATPASILYANSSAYPCTVSSPIQAFIPFLSPEITTEAVIARFEDLGIGRVSYIDMHNKTSTHIKPTNTTTYAYSYAFIKVDPYDTANGRNLRDNLVHCRTTPIVCGDSQWDIKPYMPLEERLNRGFVPAQARSTSKDVEDDLVEIDLHDDAVADLCSELTAPPCTINDFPGLFMAKEPSIFNATFRKEINSEYDQLQADIDAIYNAPEFSIWHSQLIMQ